MTLSDEPRPGTSAGRRPVRRSVRIADRVARWAITGGGVGTILAVSGVLVFLAWVTVPLFLPARAIPSARFEARWRGGGGVVRFGMDEYQVLGWAILPAGDVVSFRLDTGAVISRTPLLAGHMPTAASLTLDGRTLVLGLATGEIEMVSPRVVMSFPGEEAVPATARRLLLSGPAGTVVDVPEGVIQRTPQNQIRLHRLQVDRLSPVPAQAGPIQSLAVARRAGSTFLAAAVTIDAETRLLLWRGRRKEDLLTGRTTMRFSGASRLPLDAGEAGAPPFLLVTGSGADVIAAWTGGTFLRVHLPRDGAPFIAERGRLTADGVRLTALRLVLGGTTLAWAGEDGSVRAGFLIPREAGGRPPAEAVSRLAPAATSRLVVAKNLSPAGTSPVHALASSARSRLLLAGHEDGTLSLFDVTSATLLTGVDTGFTAPVEQVAFAPKEDGVLALADGKIGHWRLDRGHPEAGLRALFAPVWYEGYAAPRYMWQSSSGADDAEPKLSLVPLIFGTLKATFYSMLFGGPLALLAALFTSEFLDRRARAAVKPTIELMASLPSVVLGFLAALVIAPFVETLVPAVIAALLILPVGLLLGAYLWQLLPAAKRLRLGRYRFAIQAALVPAAITLAGVCGPWVERALFAGDFRAWLAWQPGRAGQTAYASTTGGWLLIWLPLAGLLAVVALSRLVNPWLRRASTGWSWIGPAPLELLKFVVAGLFTLLVATGVSVACDRAGLDPRGGFIGTYVQRNALVVGFVMGFAIVPIIYTIAEDALSTVPDHLRAASLGAGATRWQTAVRIVMPAAMSGLFAALMIGLGRAVGETMVVLMAAGNTPVMRWNIFDGFRTLSANIAVELPEAVRGSTHYRTLFLAALLLFLMTFVVNTIAELVRLRFRRRAVQL
ncbi:MAG: ABC transporter permease subunit [Acidobacteriota bacterium]